MTRMTRLALLLALAALGAAPAALGDGGPMYSMQGGAGIVGAHGLRFVAVPTASGDTTLLEIATDRSVWSWSALTGSFGIPMVTYRDAGGLSRDGRTLFLQSTTYGGTSDNTTFVVVDTRRMTPKDSFFLKGTFAFDALSPDGKRLYLTQHLDAQNASRYVVRAYDLVHDRLLPGRIADRTQRSWVMQGDALTRTVSPRGRWVYTLYGNVGGYPFIHALDTVRGVAHCIGLPWRSSNQAGLANLVLTLHGSRLAVHWRSGRPWLDVDTKTWQVAPVHGGGRFPWIWLVVGVAGAAAAARLLRLPKKGTLSARPA